MKKFVKTLAVLLLAVVAVGLTAGCGTIRGSDYQEGLRPEKVKLSGNVPADGQVVQVIKFDSWTPEVGPSIYTMVWQPYRGEVGDIRVTKCSESFWADKKSSPQDLYVTERIESRNSLWVRPISIE
jgi:hypothetical protein